MSTEVLQQALQAGVKATFGSGTQFVIVAATGPLSIVARQIGNSNKNRTFSGVPAGFKFTSDSPDDGFDTLEVTSTINQTVQMSIGNDDVAYSNSVTVANTVVTQENPTGTITDTPAVACATGAATAVVPVNTGRRRVTLSIDPTAAGVVYARAHGGANNLLPMQPGMTYEFAGTYAVDVRNDSGAAVNVYVFEES